MKTQTAQELRDCCQLVATPEPPIITRSEYCQVIDGLRMQLHLLSKYNAELIHKVNTSASQLAEALWNEAACLRMANGEAGWKDGATNNSPSVAQVKRLRAEYEEACATNVRLVGEIRELRAMRSKRGRRK